MAGTINVSRDLWDDPTFKDSEMSQREAWVWMIAGASWKARTKRIGSAELELQRGQLAASTRFMAKAWMWSEPRVRRYLDMLENRRMIRREIDAGITVITICKYDEYQNVPSDSDAPATQQPTHQRRTSDANYNKGEIRVIRDIDDDDSARDDAALMARACAAAGTEFGSLTGSGGRFGMAPKDVDALRRWQQDLGLTPAQIIASITDQASRLRSPPRSLTYFTPGLQQLAAELTAPPLQPAPHEVTHDRQPARNRRQSAADDRFGRIADAAVRNRAPSRPDFGFG